MSSISAGVCVLISLLAFFILLLWLPDKEMEQKGKGFSTSPLRWTICLGLPPLVAWYGVRRRSLDHSGGMAAIVVGLVLTVASGCFCVSLLVFFFTSSRLTRWRGREKEKFEEDHKKGGQRDWVQVVCNGGVASAAAVLYLIAAGMGELPLKLSPGRVDPPTLYGLACLSALCCSCGDTWASEVGSVLGGTPRLITTWQIVPRGTNGGVTWVGILCSIGGGLVVGLAYFLTLFVSLGVEGLGNESLVSQLPVVLIGGVAGLFGSVFDSFLGATIQYTGYSEQLGKVQSKLAAGVRHVSGVDILDNHAVNFVSSLITAIAIPAVCYYNPIGVP